MASGAASNLGYGLRHRYRPAAPRFETSALTIGNSCAGVLRRQLATNFAQPLHGLKDGVGSCVPSWRDVGAPHAGSTGTGNDTATTTSSSSNPPSVARLVEDDRAPFDA